MRHFVQGIRSFVAWEWIGSVTKSLFKLASYIVELPMVASGVYIMIATGIPATNTLWWYNLAFGVLLSAPEVLAPGAFFRAETMQARGKIRVARVTRWIAAAMLFFAALTFSSVMIFHFPDEMLQAIMFCRVMTALGYSIITRIDMDHGASVPPALQNQTDYWPFVALAAQLQQDFQQALSGLEAHFTKQLAELASNQQSALVELVTEQRLIEVIDRQSQRVNLVDLQVQRLLSEVQSQQLELACVAPDIDYAQLARAIMPHLRPNIEPAVRAIWEENQSQVQVALEPHQIEARARSQSQKKSGSRATKKPASEPEASPNGSPEERLQAAYMLFLANQISISGRALAKEAHTNRSTANAWLQKRQNGVDSGSESTTSEPVIEATVIVAPESAK